MLAIQHTHSYYGNKLVTNQDLKTTACCAATVPKKLRRLLQDVHPDVLEKFYGCGSPLPEGLEGCTVLDIGSGSGRDCFVASKLVGPTGTVIGVDMTDEQLAVARTHVDWHMQRYGYTKPNVTFLKGVIEDLTSVGIADASVDVCVSNCVLNLSPNKPQVLAEIFRVLKPGGELYFSDVFCDRRLPAALKNDQEVLGECLGGALYIEDFRRLLVELGCQDYRVMDAAEIKVTDEAIAAKVGLARFHSLTLRCFKLPELEDRCEDFGQFATYLGTLTPVCFDLDVSHRFEVGRPMAVCGNTALMLQESRFAPHFKVMGDISVHFGLFQGTGTCAPPQETASASTYGACC